MSLSLAMSFFRKLFCLEPRLASEPTLPIWPMPQLGVPASMTVSYLLPLDAKPSTEEKEQSDCAAIGKPPAYEAVPSDPKCAMEQLRKLKQRDDYALWPNFDCRFEQLCKVACPTDKEALRIYLSGVNGDGMSLERFKLGPPKQALESIRNKCAIEGTIRALYGVKTALEEMVKAVDSASEARSEQHHIAGDRLIKLDGHNVEEINELLKKSINVYKQGEDRILPSSTALSGGKINSKKCVYSTG